MPPPNQDLAKRIVELEALAVARFPSLSIPEKDLLKSVVMGQEDGVLSQPARKINSALIRWLCADAEARAYVDSFGVQVRGAEITAAPSGNTGAGMNFSSLVIPFPLAFKECKLPASIWMLGMETTFLSFEGSEIGSLDADVLRIKGDFYLRNGFKANGCVRFPGATIGGDLDCVGAKFNNLPATGRPALAQAANPSDDNVGVALNADGVSVGGDMVLRGAEVHGVVRLEGATIQGNLDCFWANLVNPFEGTREGSGTAMHADGVNIKGNAFLGGGPSTRKETFHAQGEVRLIGGQIGNQLVCTGGIFENPQVAGSKETGDALTLDATTVKVRVLCDSGFRANGKVRLPGASVGQLDCTKGKFTSLDLRFATIDRKLVLKEVLEANTATMDLRGLSVGTLEDSDGSWPQPASAKLLLDGFTYKRCAEGCGTAEGRIRWLGAMNRFTAQPYRQLAKALAEDGDSSGSRKVLYEMEHLRRGQERMRLRPLWNWILRVTVGYGYHPGWAFRWLIVSFALGSMFYWAGYTAGYIVPTDDKVYTAVRGAHALPPHYERFHASIYSLENAFPLVKLGQADRWQADPSPDSSLSYNMAAKTIAISPRFLRVFRWAQICLGWFIASMGAAAVSGIVRKD